MEYRDFRGHKISRVGIGTVQFGMSYGINNKTGQTSKGDIEAVFRKCMEHGINFIDTSRVYGSSEERVTESLDALGARKNFFISTKLDLPAGWESLRESNLLKAARASLEGSLKALRIDSIPLYLLHTERYLRFPCLWNFMLDRIAEGTVQHAGVSLEVGPESAEACFALPKLSALQIPFNALDSRWDKAGFFDRAQEQGLLVISRSSFLQGLLLMSPDELPENLDYTSAYLERLDGIAASAGMDRKTLCLRYAISKLEIGTSILGLDTAEQFDENYAVYMQGPLEGKIAALVAGAFADVPERCLNPALWKKGNR